MNAIKNFKEFIKNGIVKKQSKDKSRAKFLSQSAEQDYKSLIEQIEKLGVKDSNANLTVNNCYDLLMKLTRAKLYLEGYNASGFKAHEAEVSYLRELKFKETEVQFANQLRYFRNGILYYGTIIDAEYAEKVIEFTKKIYIKLKIKEIK